MRRTLSIATNVLQSHPQAIRGCKLRRITPLRKDARGDGNLPASCHWPRAYL